MIGQKESNVFSPQEVSLKDTSNDDAHGDCYVNPMDSISCPISDQLDAKSSNVSNSRRDKSLPIAFLSNIQSFGRSGNNEKVSELTEILALNNIDIAVFTETWLSQDTCEQLPFPDYVKFHLIRESVLRHSGGVSIFIKNHLPAKRLKVKVPAHLECLWASIRPKWLPRSVSNIIVCGVYYPGSSSKYAPPQDDLILYLIQSIHKFMKTYSKPLFLIMGDFNDLDLSDICESCNLKQVVTSPTRNQNILDKILTNSDNEFYKPPKTLPKIGDGDHLCVLYEPQELPKRSLNKRKHKVRLFKKSILLEFGFWITNFDWIEQYLLDDPNSKAQYLNDTVWAKINELFPYIKVNLTDTDEEWMTLEIKNLIFQRQIAHLQNNTDLRDHLAKKLSQK